MFRSTMGDPGYRGGGRFYKDRGRGRGGRWGDRGYNHMDHDPVPAAAQPTVQLLTRRPETPIVGPSSSTPSTTAPSTHQHTITSTGGGTSSGGPQPHPVKTNMLLQALTGAVKSVREEPKRDERRVERKLQDRREYQSSRLPVQSQTETTSTMSAGKETMGGKRVMRDASRIIGDIGELTEYIVTSVANDFLSDTNTEFRVVSAVGPQTTGKSTILSMLAGNQPLDLFRQYVFRPSSREAVETSKHQSVKVSIYVSKLRNIFIDCQATSCAAMLDEQLQSTRGDRDRRGGGGGGEMAFQIHIENIQILAWVLQVSHTVLVCHDWFIDIDLIRMIRTAELLRGPVDDIAASAQLPKLSSTRKANLVFVHTRARDNDFRPMVRADRAELLATLFQGALRVRLVDQATANLLMWHGQPRPPAETIYFPLAEMKLREMSAPSGHQQARDDVRHPPRDDVRYAQDRSTGPMSPVLHGRQNSSYNKDTSGRMTSSTPSTRELSQLIPFDEGIVILKRTVLGLPIDGFSATTDALTENEWFRYACSSWRDSTFRQSVALLEQEMNIGRGEYVPRLRMDKLTMKESSRRRRDKSVSYSDDD